VVPTVGERRAALILLLILCFAVSSLIVLVDAEPSWVEWSQTYGGTENDGSFHLVYVVETSDGGFAVASNTRSFGAGSSDFWLIKTDASGNMDWNKTYGGADYDTPYAFIQTSDGGYALAGDTRSFGNGASYFWLVKTDAYGNMLWNKTYGGAVGTHAFSLIETSDGGFALAGSITLIVPEKYGTLLVKTDDFGNMEWNQTYEETRAQSLIETPDGFALAGGAFSLGEFSDFWLAKTDASGNIVWSRTYGGDEQDEAESVVQTSDGGYALVGTTESFASGWTDCWFIKTDNLGNMKWEKIFGGEDADWGHSVIITSDGGFAIVGESNSYGAGGYDFWLVKTDGSGNIEWSRTYGGEERDSAESIVQTSDGGYILAGFTLSFGLVSSDIYLVSDIWLVRTNVQGIPEFPSWTPLLIMLLAVTVLAVIYKRKLHNPNHWRE